MSLSKDTKMKAMAEVVAMQQKTMSRRYQDRIVELQQEVKQQKEKTDNIYKIASQINEQLQFSQTKVQAERELIDLSNLRVQEKIERANIGTQSLVQPSQNSYMKLQPLTITPQRSPRPTFNHRMTALSPSSIVYQFEIERRTQIPLIRSVLSVEKAYEF